MTESAQIHKRMWDQRLLGGRTWTLCEPFVRWVGQEYSYFDPGFQLWTKTNRFQWKDVTCTACLRLRRNAR